MPAVAKEKRPPKIRQDRLRASLPLHILLVPPVLAVLLFSYVPMYGLVMAFQSYNPTQSMFKQKWIGFRYFERLFKMRDFYEILSNTLVISTLKIVTLLVFSLLLALLINEIKGRIVRGSIQAMMIFPHFFSWIILGGMVKSVFSDNGVINRFINLLGLESVYFLGDDNWFRFILIISNLWQEAGFASVLYTAAIAGIDSNLYEAAEIDGANRLQRAFHITLKSILPFVMLIAILNLGNILNAGFDQIYNLYNAAVIGSADVIDTYVFRVGLLQSQYGFGTAVGLFKSLVSCILIGLSYKLADKTTGYRVF